MGKNLHHIQNQTQLKNYVIINLFKAHLQYENSTKACIYGQLSLSLLNMNKYYPIELICNLIKFYCMVQNLDFFKILTHIVEVLIMLISSFLLLHKITTEICSLKLSTMRRHLRRLIPSLRRGYATKYTGKVVTSTNKGRFSAIEVSVAPPTLVSDVRGYPLPRRELIVEATKLLQSKSAASSPDPFLDLSEYLQALNVPPTTSEVSEILKALKSPTLALEFFHFCRSHIPNFRHDAFTYNRILLILSKSSLPDRIEKMEEIVDLMEKLRTIGNISTVNILIGAFNSVDGLDKCLELLKKWDLQLTCYTYKCLLQAYLRANDLNRALQIYGKIRRKGYILDSFAYNMLLDALAKDQKV